MRKIVLVAGLLSASFSLVDAQTPIKSKLTSIVAQIPNPPQSMDEAYKVAHIDGTGTLYTIDEEQYLYLPATEQIERLIAQLQANTQTKPEDESTREEVTSTAALKTVDQDKEIREFTALDQEMNNWRQALMTKYYNRIMQNNSKEHALVDKEEQIAINNIKSEEYDPLRTKQVSAKFFNDHIKLAKAKLDNDAKLWLNYKAEYAAGVAKYDMRLEAIGYGDKYNMPALKNIAASLQQGLLEMGLDIIHCNQHLTTSSAHWYAMYLNQPTTASIQQYLTSTFALISFL